MFPGVWGVFSVAHNLAVFQFLVLILSFTYELEAVCQLPLSGRVSYIFVQKFWIWSFVQLVHFLLDNLSCLQRFCAFSGLGPSGYGFLIIHCVD